MSLTCIINNLQDLKQNRNRGEVGLWSYLVIQRLIVLVQSNKALGDKADLEVNL